jgi:uncharacterized membrane protein YbaN (DUF454 family)
MSKDNSKRLIHKVLGVILILLGIIALVLPVFPGIVMILGGICLLHNKWINHKVKGIKSYLKNRKGK